MDRISGPGTHWTSLVITPQTLFYYDPLLPNKDYVIPSNLREFFIRCQESGKRLVTNMEADQHSMVANGYGQKVENIMCGAYSAMAILSLDKKPTVESFYDMHKRLSSVHNVRRVYHDMTN